MTYFLNLTEFFIFKMVTSKINIQTHFCGIELSPPSKEEREELEQRVTNARKERKAEYDGNCIPNSVFILRKKASHLARSS
ncbi:hypothetical protein [Pseudoalteromonas sp. G4]|uniref:hypothetical protein n=1 Tax=Pseudoalteromonas sp. G4 TaxID=2992761 RepID=UPI00237E0C5C|nr:hypothetical protein [Pseudoalteromonas sp. G4]MDE3271394.1 hypothetical protein [Pseudoalteromonas sp. G4]